VPRAGPADHPSPTAPILTAAGKPGKRARSSRRQRGRAARPFARRRRFAL